LQHAICHGPYAYGTEDGGNLVWLTIVISVAAVYAALWVAAKVFRVGLLMHGKPPNFATLVRWVRMA
jgi:ABC-2 type transport system permease protein